jgi:hypothetical protein
MSGLRAPSGSRQSSHFRLTTDHSGTGQIALGEFPTELANVDRKPDQRAPWAASGSPETPGNPAIVAPSFVNQRFAEDEVAEGARFELAGPCGPPVFKTGALNQLGHPSAVARPYSKTRHGSILREWYLS